MLLGFVPARVSLSAYTRLVLDARHRIRYHDFLLSHRLQTNGSRYIATESKEACNKDNELSPRLPSDTAPRRQGTAKQPRGRKRISQSKETDIAYESYWDEDKVSDLEKTRPELIIRGTVVIPAFATNEAKVVINAKQNHVEVTDSTDVYNVKGGNSSGVYNEEIRPALESNNGTRSKVTRALESTTKDEGCNKRSKASLTDGVSESVQSKGNLEVRIFGFLSRNRAFHGDEVVAIRQRRLRNATTETYKSQKVTNESRVISVTRRSPALENFVGMVDADSCLDETKPTFKCQPQDTRWPAFNVDVNDLDPTIVSQLRQISQKSKVFCLLRFKDWKENEMEPSGIVTKVIGDVTNPSARMYALMIFHGLNPNGFSDDVINNLNQLLKQAEERKEENRIDRRDLTVFTIDPQDAKDLDDALSVEVKKDIHGNHIYTVGVHIADVSHYVTEGSLVDLDARKRATSVYLEHQVFPMLPQMLSENLCSLLPHSEKLCFSMFADLVEQASKGEIVGNNLYICNQSFQLTRIVSGRRLSYQTAKEIIYQKLGNNGDVKIAKLASMSIQQFQKEFVEANRITKPIGAISNTGNKMGDSELIKDDSSTQPVSLDKINDTQKSCTDTTDVSTPLMILYFISRKLRDYRLRQRGAVTVDTSGSCKCHIPKVGGSLSKIWIEEVPKESHELVEEMMLLANAQAAQLLAKSFDSYFLRIHENTSKAVKQLVASMMPQELKKIINPDVLQIPELLRKCAQYMEPTAFQSLSFAALQQFKEAVYSPINKDAPSTSCITGHWGLALPMYLHFTSPIRRYSDLYTHRMLKSVIGNTNGEQSLKVLDEICKQCNLQKRRAFDVQKEYKNFAFNQYLQWACQASNSSVIDVKNDSSFAKAFNRDGQDLWGMLYSDACIFSIVFNNERDEGVQKKTSIVFYIPLLNEQRSVSCETLNVVPIEAVVDGEKVHLSTARKHTNKSCIVDSYHKEVQNNSDKDKGENPQVESLTVLKGSDTITLCHYQKISVVLIPGSVMWSVRLVNDL
ncbi:ribonuclease R, putative [Babesia ovis]|uniref:Ribonuclease R, putative n=1 Tax=Babesia ovis TaxID=5869 RepID=A0A9W5WUE6_BABOV|nr:ribonuclease R, putative [Babesia ovis]